MRQVGRMVVSRLGCGIEYKYTVRCKLKKAKRDYYSINFKRDFVVELFAFGARICCGIVEDEGFAPCVCVIDFAVVQGAAVVKYDRSC